MKTSEILQKGEGGFAKSENSPPKGGSRCIQKDFIIKKEIFLPKGGPFQSKMSLSEKTGAFKLRFGSLKILENIRDKIFFIVALLTFNFLNSGRISTRTSKSLFLPNGKGFSIQDEVSHILFHHLIQYIGGNSVTYMICIRNWASVGEYFCVNVG